MKLGDIAIYLFWVRSVHGPTAVIVDGQPGTLITHASRVFAYGGMSRPTPSLEYMANWAQMHFRHDLGRALRGETK